MKISLKELAVAIALALLMPFMVSYMLILIFNIGPKSLPSDAKSAFGLQEIIGLLSMFIGQRFITIPALSFGFILGGALSIIVGYLLYWSYLSTWLKISALIAAFIVLVYTGFWLNKKD